MDDYSTERMLSLVDVKPMEVDATISRYSASDKNAGTFEFICKFNRKG